MAFSLFTTTASELIIMMMSNMIQSIVSRYSRYWTYGANLKLIWQQSHSAAVISQSAAVAVVILQLNLT